MDSVDNLCELLIYCFNEGLSPTNIIDWKRLLELADSDSLEVRVCLAKALVNQPVDSNTVELLVKLTKDPSPNVRVEAVDTLGAFPTKASYDRLCVCLNDSDQLVRAYASFGVAVVGKEISPQSALKVLQEKENNVRIYIDVLCEQIPTIGKTIKEEHYDFQRKEAIADHCLQDPYGYY